MTRREKKTIMLALAILKRAAKAGANEPLQLDAVQLALRVLLVATRSDHLTSFWRILADPPGFHRTFRLRKMIDLIEPDTIRHIAGVTEWSHLPRVAPSAE